VERIRGQETVSIIDKTKKLIDDTELLARDSITEFYRLTKKETKEIFKDINKTLQKVSEEFSNSGEVI
jgi:hypothetical protein